MLLHFKLSLLSIKCSSTEGHSSQHIAPPKHSLLYTVCLGDKSEKKLCRATITLEKGEYDLYSVAELSSNKRFAQNLWTYKYQEHLVL